MIEVVFGDEPVRKAQEELRKRHLFYGDITGEVSPALTVAISSYQQKKGLTRSGRLDLETSASLGLMKAPVKSIRINPPFVLAAGGELRGANGEALPNSAVTYRSSDRPFVELTSSAANGQQVALVAAGDHAASLTRERRALNPSSYVRSRRVLSHKATNPLVAVFRTVDHAIVRLFVGDTPPKKKRIAASRL